MWEDDPGRRSRPGVKTEDHRRRGDADGRQRPRQPGPARIRRAGPEPDARFTFANERTFLAWIRTALALVAAGLAIVQLLPPFPGIRWGRHAIGIPLILLGAVVAVYSYLEWHANQRALRRGDPLRRSWLPELLAVVIGLVALAAAALALVSG